MQLEVDNLETKLFCYALGSSVTRLLEKGGGKWVAEEVFEAANLGPSPHVWGGGKGLLTGDQAF